MALTIITQPNGSSLKAAYNPIVFIVNTDELIPVAFCDVYFDGIFYKTLSTTYQDNNLTFDIRDAAQEYLRKFLPPNGGSVIEPASSLITECICKFRGSSVNVNGLIDIEPVIPIQGTLGVDPVPGTGIESNKFYILNSTLQHDDNPDLSEHLNTFKKGVWDSLAKPLSHRFDGYKVLKSDYFPIVYTGIKVLSCIELVLNNIDGSTSEHSGCDLFPGCPVLTSINIVPEDNGNGTQTFNFSWDTPDPLLTGVKIWYSPAGSGVWTITAILPPASGITLILPLGLYDFQIETLGPCNPTIIDGFFEIGIEPADCVELSVPGSPSMPDAVILQPYSYIFPVTGTAPFTLSAITKPSWMTINPVGNNIVFGGTPLFADIGTEIEISFTISNCGIPTYDFSDTIDVINNFQKSKFENDLLTNLSNVTITKMTAPSVLIYGPVDVIAGAFISFLTLNYSGVDIGVNFSGTAPVNATLESNGNTYIGTITPNFVSFTNVDIVNAMIINFS